MKVIVLFMMSFVVNLSIAQNEKIKVVKEKIKIVSKTKREYEIIDNNLAADYDYYTKHGYYREFYKKDTVVSGHYRYDQKEGDWVYKDPEENYLQKGKFHKGKKVGEWYSYKKDFLSSKEYYSNNGRLDSVFGYNKNKELVSYYYYDPILKINYSNDSFGLGIKREVIRTDSIKQNIKLFYPNGQLLEERRFKNERLIYVSDIYKKDGSILIPTKMNMGYGLLQTIYLDSILEGKYSIKDKVYYKNGIPEGEQTNYDKQGKLLRKGVNKEGFPFGEWTNWNKKKNKYTLKTYVLNSQKSEKEKKVFLADKHGFNHNIHKRTYNGFPIMFMKNRNKIDYSESKKYFSKIINKCIVENTNTAELAKYFPKSKDGVCKIAVMFKINTLGEVSDIKVKSKSKSILVKYRIEEALSKLPLLIPSGTSENGKFVNLEFSLPIVFKVL